ncbi:RNA chaperone Hfq [Rhodocista pekingensis]|uniref:RNA chaperone Hfq n=1 Tax=Rhodocista pekingensis TaxID=201185 RepID=A0ABW2L079_9PROT
MAFSEALQSKVLDVLRTGGTEVTVFLVTGVRLVGRIVAHDAYSLALTGHGGGLQLIYKHAVTTLVPSSPLSLYDPSSSADRTAAAAPVAPAPARPADPPKKLKLVRQGTRLSLAAEE